MPLHPLTVHLPIGILLSCLGLVVWQWIQYPVSKELSRLLTAFLAAGGGSVLLAVLTGRTEGSFPERSKDWEALYRNHELMGYGLLWGVGILLIWSYLRAHKWGRREVGLFGLALLGLCLLMALGAHAGGEMVFLYGTGVKAP